MKILISADMEGVTGVINWKQVSSGQAEYERFRRLLTQDVNAAVTGALEAGADAVTITDGHADGANILVEDLDPRAKLISGSPAPLSMMQGIGRDVDGVFFIGYHARQGSANAVLDHTWSDTSVANVWLNDVPAGEYTLNAAVAGHFGVPILMASGDQTACAQMQDQLGGIETAIVKHATGRFSAECLVPGVTYQLIHDAAQRAVKRLTNKTAPDPYIVQKPVKVTVELVSSDMADKAMLLSGSTRDGRLLSFLAEDAIQAYLGFRALVGLAG